MVCERLGVSQAGIKVCYTTTVIRESAARAQCVMELTLIVHVYRADDLIPEENVVVQLALKRLSSKEAYDRVFRMRRAFQVRPLKLAADRRDDVARYILTCAR